jgi:chromosomal replication initiation ATPase DnaA
MLLESMKLGCRSHDRHFVAHENEERSAAQPASFGEFAVGAGNQFAHAAAVAAAGQPGGISSDGN